VKCAPEDKKTGNKKKTYLESKQYQDQQESVVVFFILIYI